MKQSRFNSTTDSEKNAFSVCHGEPLARSAKREREQNTRGMKNELK